MLLATLAQRCRRLSPLLAAPAVLLLSQGQAKAVLTYNIFESGGNVVVQASGSLNLTGSQPDSTNYIFCGVNGAIISDAAVICTGTDGPHLDSLKISGPTNFNGTAAIFPASSVSGIFTILYGLAQLFVIDPTYVSSTPIVSSATFNSTTLAGLGFTATGLIGTWSLTGTSETIQVILGAPAPPAAAVPGPLPLLGAGAAFGWSRRLRKRIATPLITSSQA